MKSNEKEYEMEHTIMLYGNNTLSIRMPIGLPIIELRENNKLIGKYKNIDECRDMLGLDPRYMPSVFGIILEKSIESAGQKYVEFLKSQLLSKQNKAISQKVELGEEGSRNHDK